jgi:hypothetical protein
MSDPGQYLLNGEDVAAQVLANVGDKSLHPRNCLENSL